MAKTTRPTMVGGDELDGFDPGSPAQIDVALRLLAKERHLETLQPALDVLRTADESRIRLALRAKYAWCAEEPGRRDSGGSLRTALLQTLAPVASREDIPLLEGAIATYEFMPPFLPPSRGDVAAALRAQALVTLSGVDPVLAGYHATRLLMDPYTSIMSGQPALTAVAVLGDLGETLPVYAYALRGGQLVPDVLGECLRTLTPLPDALLAPLITHILTPPELSASLPVSQLIERYGDDQDEIVLLGLFDLLLAQRSRELADSVLTQFLRATRLYALYRYLVHAIVAGRHEALIAELRALAKAEREPRKREILQEGLALRPSPGGQPPPIP